MYLFYVCIPPYLSFWYLNNIAVKISFRYTMTTIFVYRMKIWLNTFIFSECEKIQISANCCMLSSTQCKPFNGPQWLGHFSYGLMLLTPWTSAANCVCGTVGDFNDHFDVSGCLLEAKGTINFPLESRRCHWMPLDSSRPYNAIAKLAYDIFRLRQDILFRIMELSKPDWMKIIGKCKLRSLRSQVALGTKHYVRYHQPDVTMTYPWWRHTQNITNMSIWAR